MHAAGQQQRAADSPKPGPSARKGAPIKKALSLVLEDAEVIELVRILMDDDAHGALDFLKVHFKGKAKELLEGG